MRRTALVAKVPHGHWKTLTSIEALRRNEITASFVFDGPIDADRFVAWVDHSPVPGLKPGDVVVLDNLGRKRRSARMTRRQSGRHSPSLHFDLQS